MMERAEATVRFDKIVLCDVEGIFRTEQIYAVSRLFKTIDFEHRERFRTIIGRLDFDYILTLVRFTAKKPVSIMAKTSCSDWMAFPTGLASFVETKKNLQLTDVIVL